MSSDAPIPTLQDVLDKIETLEAGTKKRDLKSAVMTFCKVTGKSPNDVLAVPRELRLLRESVSPLAAGLTERRWANVCSGLTKAIELVRELIPSRNTTPAQTKTHAHFEAALHPNLIPWLETYLAQHRPILLACEGRWKSDPGEHLWVSKHGSPMTEIAIYDRVSRLTEAEFRASLPMQLGWQTRRTADQALRPHTHLRNHFARSSQISIVSKFWPPNLKPSNVSSAKNSQPYSTLNQVAPTTLPSGVR